MRLVIGEDEALFREGLRLVLEQAGCEVAAVTDSATELDDLVAEHRPDVVLTDLRMPPTLTDDGLQAAVRLRRAHPGLGVMVLSQFVQRRYAEELITGGVTGVGYQLKQRVAAVGPFVRDLRTVAAGGTALDPDVVALLMARGPRSSRDRGGLDRLTPRQQAVLALLAQGLSNAAIANALSVSDRTVVHHTSSIYDALDLPPDDHGHRRVLAVLRYLVD